MGGVRLQATLGGPDAPPSSANRSASSSAFKDVSIAGWRTSLTYPAPASCPGSRQVRSYWQSLH